MINAKYISATKSSSPNFEQEGLGPFRANTYQQKAIITIYHMKTSTNICPRIRYVYYGVPQVQPYQVDIKLNDKHIKNDSDTHITTPTVRPTLRTENLRSYCNVNYKPQALPISHSYPTHIPSFNC